MILTVTVLLSILMLQAEDYNIPSSGFTVTYLMLERQDIALPQDQMQADDNSSENEIQ